MILNEKKTINKIIQSVGMFFWITFLIGTDSYYSIYVLIGIIGFVSLFSIKKDTDQYIRSKKNKIATHIFSSFFSMAVVLANYKLVSFMRNGGVLNIAVGVFDILMLLVGGFFVAFNVLGLVNSLICKKPKEYKKKMTPAKIFWLCFVSFSIINLIILMACYFPGNLSYDSINEINQMYSGVYSNHHPFYFTIFVQAFFSIGVKIFGSTNAGILIYVIVQLLIMSGIFSFGIMTMYQKSTPKIFIFIAIALYAFMPYHIVYSFTVWKDVLFGGLTLLLIITSYRALNNMNSIVNTILMIISCFGVCLFRSNGWFAFIIMTMVFAFLFKKKYLKMLIMFVSVIFISFLLKWPLLSSIGVSQPDTIESLSIPTQQIARVITNNRDSLSQDEKELIEKLASLDDIAEVYDPACHDPIKHLIRKNGTVAYLSEHKAEFLKIYLQIGIKNPVDYLLAWIDQTRGYWNGGYKYWIIVEDIYPNDYAIERTIKLENVKKLFSAYTENFQNIGLLQPFESIGLAVWILWLFLYIGIVKSDKKIIFATIPLCAIWLSLLIATPVFAEFRYIYSIFCCLPFLLILIFEQNKNKQYT